jgi:hypothetical protein
MLFFLCNDAKCVLYHDSIVELLIFMQNWTKGLAHCSSYCFTVAFEIQFGTPVLTDWVQLFQKGAVCLRQV